MLVASSQGEEDMLVSRVWTLEPLCSWRLVFAHASNYLVAMTASSSRVQNNKCCIDVKWSLPLVGWVCHHNTNGAFKVVLKVASQEELCTITWGIGCEASLDTLTIVGRWLSRYGVYQRVSSCLWSIIGSLSLFSLTLRWFTLTNGQDKRED